MLTNISSNQITLDPYHYQQEVAHKSAHRLDDLTVREPAPLAAFLLVFSGIIIWVVLDNPPTAQAATIEKCGDLTSDDTWTSDNIYVVNCDLTVMDSITLTIQAGTVVKFDGHDTDINIDGTLDLQGTASSRVIFTSE